MRGKHAFLYDTVTGLRIIPAHAGQTDVGARRPRLIMDHPRACGANNIDCDAETIRLGSSPRMRGKRAGLDIMRLPRRIIPAHAGQTRRWRSVLRPNPDHPRACGANLNA